MGPAFRLNMATCHLLQAIISNSRCRAKPLLEITRFNQVPFVLGMMAPDTGITIGLEFHSDRERVSFHLGYLSLKAMYLFGDAKEILHVMADLMGDHIGLSKVTRRSKTMRHFIEEGKV